MTLKRKIHRVLPRFTQGSTSEANRIHDKNKKYNKRNCESQFENRTNGTEKEKKREEKHKIDDK